MNYSFWEKKYIQSLTDVTIIGSGIVGLSTAISIKEKQPWLSVKILERGYMPYGASTKNAGFSCFGSVSELLDDIEQIGEQKTIEIVKMRYEGLQRLKSRVPEAIMDYKNNGGTELFRKTDGTMIEECFSKLSYCNSLLNTHLGLNDCYSIVKNKTMNAFHSTGIYNKYEGTINPVLMMNELWKKAIDLGVSILYGIQVDEVDRSNHIIFTKSGDRIDYKRLVVCTNGFTQSLFHELEVIPARNQVLITKKLFDNPLSSGYHMDKGYTYFRNYEGRILLGGGRNLDIKGETTDQFGHTPIIQDYLKQLLDQIYPGASAHIEHWWSGILGVGPSKYPISQWLDDHVLAGVRLGGMGVAIGSFLGEKLANELVSSD